MRSGLISTGVVLVAGALLFAQADDAVPGQEAPQAPTQRDLLSYGVGFYIGEEVREGLRLDGVDANLDLVMRGFADGLAENAPMLPREELEEILFIVHEEMQARMVERMLVEDPAFKALHDRNLERSRAFHERHGGQEGVVTLGSGLQYEVIREGAGASPGPEDTVIATFRVTLIDGTEVNSGDNLEVELDTVAAGGSQLVQMMKVGGRRRAAIPPHLAFGGAGKPPLVGPNETLLVEVELVGIKDE